jgi:hypothetical protein
MKHFYLFSCSLFLFFFSQYTIQAQTVLRGDIGDMTFDRFRSPYIIEEDIFISEGKKALLQSGTVFLFKSFTGLNIYGSVSVEGTEENNVIFSSANDGTYNDSAAQLPKAFDWNGILIDRRADKVNFRNFRVSYSVFGIKSKKENIVLINGIFRENGQFNFTINDDVQMVEEKVSYSYGRKSEMQQQQKTPDTAAVPAGKDVIKLHLVSGDNKKKPNTKLDIPIYVTLASGGALAVTSLVFGLAARNYRQKFEEPPTAQNPWNENDRKSYNSNFKVFRAFSMVSGITAGASLGICTALGITRHNRAKKNNGVALYLDSNGGRYSAGITGKF